MVDVDKQIKSVIRDKVYGMWHTGGQLHHKISSAIKHKETLRHLGVIIPRGTYTIRIRVRQQLRVE